MKFGSANAIYDYAGHRRFTAPTTSAAYYMMNYNHKNERTIRTTQNKGVNNLSTTTQYIYDEASRLQGEYTAAGVPIVEYIWVGERPIAAVYGSGTATKIYWIASDALNTPRRLFDSANHAVVWAWDSTAFGVAPPSVTTVKFNLRFAGQYFDELTKQHYNLNRYYNPQIGRYMEPDPIGLEGGLNPYAYAGSSPVSNSDPTGLASTNRIAAIRPLTDPVINSTVLRLQQEIQQLNPSFRYNVIVPAGQPTYTMNDVFFLQREFSRLSGERSIPLLGGASRSTNYSQYWQSASLVETVRRFAGNDPLTYNSTNRQKTYFVNRNTGVEVIYDLSGNYFRVNDPNIASRRSFLDLSGNAPNNKTLPSGIQTGMSAAEYNAATHFNALP